MNYVINGMGNVAIIIIFNVQAYNVDYATIRVDKVTLRSTEAHNSIGWRPVMVEYRVYFDTSPGPPPCEAPYCPYSLYSSS